MPFVTKTKHQKKGSRRLSKGVKADHPAPQTDSQSKGSKRSAQRKMDTSSHYSGKKRKKREEEEIFS